MFLYKLFSLISNKKKKYLFFLLILLILSGLVEYLTLASVTPILQISTQNIVLSDIKYFPIVSDILSFFISQNKRDFLPIFLIILVFCSSTLRLFLIWLNAKVSAKIGSELSCNSFSNAINQTYEEYLTSNSSFFLNAITSQISIVVGVINQILILIYGFIILSALFYALLVINPLFTLIISSSVVFIYVAIILLFRPVLRSNRKNILYFQQTIIKTIQESYIGMRDTILLGLQDLYYARYKKLDLPMRNLIADNTVISGFPKYILEGSVLIFIIFFVTKSSSLTAKGNFVLFEIGTFALGAQKILPVLQQIYSALTEIRLGREATDIISELLMKKNISLTKKEQLINLDFNHSIVLNKVNFLYKNTDKFILKNIDLKIKKGERVAFVGPTGGGKSTLFDILMGLIPPSSGNFIIDDNIVDFKNNLNNLLAWRNQISYVPQKINLIDETIIENIALGLSIEEIDFNLVVDCCKKACLSKFINELENNFYTKVGERGIRLSGGQCQRLAIARALYKKKSVLFLDEATSALDKKTEASIINNIKDLDSNITIILIAHRLSTIEFCDIVYELDNSALKRIK